MNLNLPKNKWGNLIKDNKYLNNSRYYKNNIWSMAHFESCAANGRAGGCGICRVEHYNGSLENKRHSKRVYVSGKDDAHIKGKSTWKGNSVTRNLCYDCINKIEDIINYNFKRDYAP